MLTRVRAIIEENKSTRVKEGDVIVAKHFGYCTFQGADKAGKIYFVMFPWGSAAVQKSLTSQFISIKIISFVNNMPSFIIRAKPVQALQTVKDQVALKFKLKSNQKFRLAYKGKELRDRDYDALIWSFGISFQDCEMLFVLDESPVVYSLVFDSTKLFSGEIKLSQEQKSAEMISEISNWSSLRCTPKISEGRCYWDVLIEQSTYGSIIIGIVGEGHFSSNNWVGGHSKSVGYLNDGSIWRNGSFRKRYGEKFVSGDVIRVQIDMKSRSITFFKNGKDLGMAFKRIPEQVYPAFSLFHSGDRISLQSFSKC
jgi:hypothetical protein